MQRKGYFQLVNHYYRVKVLNQDLHESLKIDSWEVSFSSQEMMLLPVNHMYQKGLGCGL